MPAKPYSQVSSFWYLGIPAAVFGIGYFLWNSHGWVSMEARQLLSPIVYWVSGLFGRLI